MKHCNTNQYLTSNIREAQVIMLEILKVFKEICKKEKLQYWLDAGTLLGAVRHKGFIPWDDDIDVCMPRKDYEKFIKLAQNSLPKDIVFQFGENSLKKWKWIKLRKENTFFEQKTEINKNDLNYHRGIFIDIFPYDLIDNDFNNKKIFLNRRFQFHSNKILKSLSFILNPTCSFIVKTIGYNYIKNRILTKHSTQQFSIVSTGVEITLGFKNYKKEIVFPLKEILFEDDYFLAPADSHQYLTQTYGNYMQIPSKENRQTHASFISIN